MQYGVFKWTDHFHSTQCNGGYVVRTACKGADGGYWYPEPYSTITPERTFAREYDAKRFADRLNAR